MTCQDAIALLSDYLELALGAETIADLERHLGECAPCVAYLNTFRATRKVAAEAARVEMPEEMKERLRSFLLARLR
jgi:predicted anti-sigma-YlaC factor YlaD